MVEIIIMRPPPWLDSKWMVCVRMKKQLQKDHPGTWQLFGYRELRRGRKLRWYGRLKTRGVGSRWCPYHKCDPSFWKSVLTLCDHPLGLCCVSTRLLIVYSLFATIFALLLPTFQSWEKSSDSYNCGSIKV